MAKKIAPTDTAPVEWIVGAHGMLTHYKKTGTLPRANNIPMRAAKCSFFSITCIPCCMWSTFWRFVACPCMCCLKGGSFACSDNGCTTLSDGCIEASWRETFRHRALMPLPNLSEFTLTETRQLVEVFNEIIALFKEDPTQYELADALFATTLGPRCTPNTVLAFIHAKCRDTVQDNSI